MGEQLQFSGVQVGDVDLRQARFAGVFDIEVSDADLMEQGEPMVFVVVVRPNGGSYTTNRKTGDTKWKDTLDIVDARVVDDDGLRDVLVDRLDLEWPDALDLATGGGAGGSAGAGTDVSAGVPDPDVTRAVDPGPADGLPPDPEFDVDDEPAEGPDEGPKFKPLGPPATPDGPSERQTIGNIHDYRRGRTDEGDGAAKTGRQALDAFLR